MRQYGLASGSRASVIPGREDTAGCRGLAFGYGTLRGVFPSIKGCGWCVQVLPGRFSKSLLSKKAEDHLFEPFADHTLRRKGTEAPQEAKKEKKIKPNEPCP